MRLLQFRWRRFGVGAVGLLSLFVVVQIILRISNKRHPRPIPASLAPVLRSSFRRKCFGTPEQIVARAGVTPGMRVLEIGPGPGYFTAALARRVASQSKQGNITCVELQLEMIDMLRQRLIEEHLNNVEVVQGDAQKLSFPEESFDLIFLATVIGEVPDKQALFHDCAQLLKPGGILAVTEQVVDPDFLLPRSVRKLATRVGLQDAGHIGLPWWIYTARYRKPIAVPNLERVV